MISHELQSWRRRLEQPGRGGVTAFPGPASKVDDVTREAARDEGPKADQVAQLRAALARLGTGAEMPAAPRLPLDGLADALPAGGLACGVLHELTAAYADRPAAFGFLFALATLAQAERPGLVVCILTRQTVRDFGLPYAHGLAQIGLDPGAFVLVEAANDRDALWALEEALRTPGLAMVVGGLAGDIGLTPARRLNLAAAATGTPLAVLRLGREATGPAATRWRIAAAPAAQDETGAFTFPRWQVALERSRNGRPGHWLIEWSHVAHRFRVVEGLAHRAPAAGGTPPRPVPVAPGRHLRRAG